MLKIKYICKFAIDGIIARKKTCLFAIIMMVTSFIMINLTFLQINNTFLLKLKIEDVTDNKMSNVIYSFCNEDLGENYISFLKESISQNNIVKYGFYQYEYQLFEELQTNEEFLNIIEKKNDDVDINSEDGINGVQVLQLDNTLYDICNIHDEKGNKIKYNTNDEFVPIYVGYDYRNAIEVGSIITSKKIVKKNKKFVYEEVKFKVYGILERGAYWLEDRTIEAMNNPINLDSSFVTFKEYSMYDKKDRCLYVVNNEKEVERTIDIMSRSAVSKRLNIKISTVDNVINEKTKSDLKDMKVYITLAAFITLITILSNSAMSTVAILLRKKDFGIMYVNGISRKDVRRIVACENIIKIVISIIIAVAYVYCGIFMNYAGRDLSSLENLLYVQTRITIFEVISIGGLIVILSSIVPIFIVNRLNVVELIGGND